MHISCLSGQTPVLIVYHRLPLLFLFLSHFTLFRSLSGSLVVIFRPNCPFFHSQSTSFPPTVHRSYLQLINFGPFAPEHPSKSAVPLGSYCSKTLASPHKALVTVQSKPCSSQISSILPSSLSLRHPRLWYTHTTLSTLLARALLPTTLSTRLARALLPTILQVLPELVPALARLLPALQPLAPATHTPQRR